MKILFALAGFILWNWGDFQLGKDDSDNAHTDFPFKKYAKEHWETWVGSLFMCLFLFATMKLGYGVDLLSISTLDLKWSDALISASGPMYQILIWGIKKVKKFTSQS